MFPTLGLRSLWMDDILNATHLNECVRVGTHSGTELRLSRRQQSIEMRLHRGSSPHKVNPGVRNINKSLPQVPLVRDNKCTDHRSAWPNSDALHSLINPEPGKKKRSWDHLGSFTGPKEKMDPYESNAQLSSEFLYCRPGQSQKVTGRLVQLLGTDRGAQMSSTDT